jgi:hypothetical protein
MKQIIDFLINRKFISSANIIYIDKEDLKFDFIKNYEELYNYIEETRKNIK